MSMCRFRVNDDVNAAIKDDCLQITDSTYTSILKDSHENIDKYVGKKIKYTGFVYRLYDFNENQFVLAREMIISSDNHGVVVGFLCDCDDLNGCKASNFKTGTWVEVEGVIEKGYYHCDLPVVNVTKITGIDGPSGSNNGCVMPPTDSYVRTEI